MGRQNEFPLLQRVGLKACEILGDGNCLFNALSDQIYGDQSKHQEIRLKVIQHMRENPDNFKPFIIVGEGQRRNPKRKNAGALSSQFSFQAPTEEQMERAWEEHLERMARGGTYGDNMEIRAFTQAYNTDVKIFQSDLAYYVRVNDDGVIRPVAFIAYHTWEHYSSIRNINGPFKGLPNVQEKELSPEDAPKIRAATPNSIPIQEWMIRSVITSLPHLTVDEATVRKTLEEHGGSVDRAVTKLLDLEYPSSPPSPGSYSQSGSSSIERDPDSDDDEIRGPNKRQNRRMSRATKASRKGGIIVPKIEPEQTIPTIELTEPDSEVSSELPNPSTLSPLLQLVAQSQLPSHLENVPETESAIKSKVHKTKKVVNDNEYVAPSDNERDGDFQPDEDNDATSSYSASSGSQPASIESTPPPRPRPKIILRTKTAQKQQLPQKKKLMSARERKELKKAAQKQARKESKRSNANQQPINSTTNINPNRNSPPVEQVIGMKTLYI